MRNIKRMLALVLTLCMVIGLMPAVFAAEGDPVFANEDEIIIYFTNDVHTYLDKTISYDNLAWLKQQTLAQTENVLLVDAGDFSQGTAYGSMDKGNTIIELMNATGYDLATLGNHEFDYGMKGMFDNYNLAEFPYISCNFVHVFANPFEDVPEGEWYTEAVKGMLAEGLMVGISDTVFGVNETITRAQFAAILWRACGEPEASEDYVSPFTDVPKGEYYTEAAAWCNEEGLIVGTADDKFDPNLGLSREMLVTILARLFEVELDDEAREWIDENMMAGYKDFDKISDWAKDAMRFAVASGLVSGTSATTLEPTSTCTRAQCAKILDPILGPVETVMQPFVYYDCQLADGEWITIGFLGITTPETFTKSTPAYFQDEDGNYIFDIYGGEDGQALYDAVQRYIDEMADFCDYIIGVGHLGDDPASKPWTSAEVIANTVGLDALIDGHSHSTNPTTMVKDKAGNEVLLAQTGNYFDAIGRMVVTKDGISSELITAEVTKDDSGKVIDVNLVLGDQVFDMGSDEAVAEIKNEWMTEVDTKLGEVMGVSEVDLLIKDKDGRQIRSREMNIGDFCADALYYLFDVTKGLDVDVAIMNGGGIRADALKGEWSYKTFKTVHTFGNVACLQTITGQQLLDALEWGAKNVGVGENGGFLHVSGITYEIHSYIPSTVQADDKGVWIGGPTGEYRVKNVKILQDGKYVDLDLDAKYNLAGYNYTLRDLGDGFAMFDGAVNVLDYVMEDYLVLANYMASFPVDAETELPTITEDSIYADPYGDGRITIVTEAPAAG